MYRRRIIRRLKWPIKYWTAFTAGLVGLLVLASLTLVHQRRPVVPDHARPADSVPATRDIAMRGEAVADRGDAVQQATAIDLRSASETFRNGTLVFAIRRAGFYCADVVSAHESADGLWVASCPDMLGYVVTLHAPGRFDVHPVAQYFDGVTPILIDRDRPLEPRPLAPRPLEPQPLR
jgi:hypothetical protein